VSECAYKMHVYRVYGTAGSAHNHGVVFSVSLIATVPHITFSILEFISNETL